MVPAEMEPETDCATITGMQQKAVMTIAMPERCLRRVVVINVFMIITPVGGVRPEEFREAIKPDG
jgi:hypothetical protein